MKVLILCVDYNTELSTKEYVNTILKYDVDCDISITCNSGSSAFSFYEDNERVSIFDPKGNLGYMEGANQGLLNYLKTNKNPDWVVLSNTDISFDVEQFCKILKDSDLDKILAPDILTNDDVHQNPFLVNRPKKSKLVFLKFVYSHKVLYSLYNVLFSIKANVIKKVYNDDSRFIYAPHGSFVVFPKLYFSKGADLSHPTFLYGEELFIAERARKIGMEVKLEPRIKIRHFEHVATASKGGVLKAKCLSKSLDYIINKFFG